MVLRGEKDKNCDPDDPDDRERGSHWDHVIIDPETKLIVSLVVGRRDADTVVRLFTDFYGRTDGYLPELICTDEYAVYETVILDTYGVCKHELELTLEDSERSRSVNTSFVERYHGTHRQFNARKKRKAYTFSKELSFHEAATWLVVVWYNFGWCVRTLREKVQEDPPRYHHRTPAMAAGLADHAWRMGELLRHPLYPPTDAPPQTKPRTYADVLERLKGAFLAETTDGS